MRITAVCPGSFDPVTIGHMDIIRRAAQVFGRVIVLVLPNLGKEAAFSLEERVAMVKRCITGLPNVSCDSYSGLLADYTKREGATVIVKGLRAVSDFEYEFQMALTNRKLDPAVDTVFFTASADHMYLSSSIVKQVAGLGGDICEFVPGEIHLDIKNRLFRPNNGGSAEK